MLVGRVYLFKTERQVLLGFPLRNVEDDYTPFLPFPSVTR